MIAVIGLGGAGGNIADEASKFGFHTGAINFSQKDLDSLENVELKLRLSGSEGVGSNRDEATRLLAQHHEIALDFIYENFSSPSIDIIVFAFSTGGGSGSGIAPLLLDVCSGVMSDKVFVSMPIIPDNNEAVIAHINCLKTIDELSGLEMAHLPIDNQKIFDHYKVKGKGDLYKLSNKKAVELLNNLYLYTEKSSKNGNFDKKDMQNLFKTNGVCTISEVDFDKSVDGKVDISRNGLTDSVVKSWENSVFCDVNKEKVVKSAVIFDGKEEYLKFIDHSSIFDNFESGLPIYLFNGNYHESSGKIMTALTGMSWSNERLDEIEMIIEDNKGKLNRLYSSQTNKYTFNSTIGESLVGELSSQPKEKRSALDTLKKWKK